MTECSFPALRFRQGTRDLFSLIVPSRDLGQVLAVSRLHRSNDGLKGYQRSEVLRHVADIRRYVEQASALLPNALVVAFDERTRFAPLSPGADVVHGELIVPIDTDRPAGWVVDGQQRLAALSAAGRDDFPVCVVGFCADNEQEAAEQFLLVNSTKPLPRALLHELLPSIAASLPPALEARRLPAALAEHLQHRDDSPFRNRLQTQTFPTGDIRDTSVLRMLGHSLSDGILFALRSAGPDGTPDFDAMAARVKVFWRAVAAMWPQAWNLPPRASRLTHGAGIVAMGFVMDTLLATPRSPAQVRQGLRALARHTAWTEGSWAFEDGVTIPWNGLQNTHQDAQRLTRHLLRHLP